MADHTDVEWADATVPAINGCSLKSPGCANCYAMKQAHRVEFRRPLVMMTKGGMVWNGEVYLHERALLQPLSWRRPRRIFWNAHGDTFHEKVPDEWIDKVFAVCALTPQHTHMILTKRPERMRAYFNDRPSAHEVWRMLDGMPINAGQAAIRDSWYGGPAGKWPLPNVWLGTSVEDQTRANERIPHLLQTPAAVRFLSCEPLLGAVDLKRIRLGEGDVDQSRPHAEGLKKVIFNIDALAGVKSFGWPGIDWVIVGGENGPRPMHPDWVFMIRDQCASAGVPFFFKQWGSWAPTGSVDVYCHGPERRDRQYPNSPGIAWLADGRICLKDFTVAEHARRLASGEASSARAVEVNEEALAAFHATLDLRDGPINPLGYQWMYRIGKKAAGRLLDGAEHNGMPA